MVLIEVLTSPTCRYCDAAKLLVSKVVEDVKTSIPEIRVKIIDLKEHPEVGYKYDVMATPAIAIDGKLVFVGVPKEDELRRILSPIRAE